MGNILKNKWFLVVSGIIILILLMLTSSVISIGDRLSNINIYLTYSFYGLVFILVYFLILRPVVFIIFSPSLKIPTTVDKSGKKGNHKALKKVSRRLSKNANINDKTKKEIDDSYKDYEKLRQALNKLYNGHLKKEVNKIVRKHARTVMISTAISQSGRLDFFTVLAVNLKMIKEIVEICGYRPSYRNLSKLTLNVFVTALIAEGLENINISDVIPQSTMSLIGNVPFLKPVLSSVTQGVSNALLTLRIGIVTRKYLFDDAKEITKQKIQYGAFVEAAAQLPLVVADGISIFPKKLFSFMTPKSKEATEENN